MIEFSRSVILSRVDDETVLLDTETGTYYQLNATATEMVELLREGRPTTEVVSTLVERYEVEEDTLRSDLSGLVSALRRKGLVHGASDDG